MLFGNSPPPRRDPIARHGRTIYGATGLRMPVARPQTLVHD
jgi:hypothetical protein